MRVINVTLARLAKRANAAIRLSGIRAAAGKVMPSSRTDFSRSIAARRAGPLTRVGPERSLSSQEPRLPSGTVSKYSSRLGDVFPTLLAGSISLQIVAVGKTQLARERLQDRRRHRYGIIEEGTEIADGGELQSETQAVVFTPADRDLCQIFIVEVVVAGQLVRRRRGRVTSVVFTLLTGEETNRHAGIRPRLERHSLTDH